MLEDQEEAKKRLQDRLDAIHNKTTVCTLHLSFLFCVVLCCFVLFCFVLFCFVLFCFVLFCFVLFCFVFLF